jgi:hypothetical protein
MQLLALAAAVMVACSHAPASNTDHGQAPQGSSTPPPATAALPAAIPGVYAKACATECADEAAQLVTLPGSERAKHFDAIRTQQLDGLTKAETMQCRDVKH